ncbi:Rap1a/Tai family immunity protein [Xanthobacter wiegelii]|uniref:Rap1a/Tai family immunity protein n=1 Tax=Xanthobacter wiegelii TaxID=3119913 RepID=UPI0037365E4A
MRRACTTAFVLLAVNAASTTYVIAEPSGADMVRQLKLSPELARTYIEGLSSGIDWTNTAISTMKKGSPLFCPPPNISITIEQVENILIRYLANKPSEAQYPVGFVMLKAFRDTFPCP